MLRLLIVILFFTSIQVYSQTRFTIHFESGKAELSQADKARLDSLTYTFETELQYKIRIIGHTDSIGSFAGNKILSEKRAATVEKYLSGNKRIIHFDKTGEAFLYPVQSNATEKGRADNRRDELYIEIIMVKPPHWEMQVQSFAFKNTSKNILHTKRGCRVIVESNSFIVGKDDTVTILITEYNDPADFIAGGLPMSYSSNGKTKMYQSEQMMKIEAFIDSVPVKLFKLLGLECPNVDTANGVKFYEFHADQDAPTYVFPKTIHGKVEAHPVEIEKPPVVKVAGEQKVQKEEAKTTEKENSQSEKQEEKVKEEQSLPENISDSKVKLNDKIGNIQLDPDTGTTFLLEPDTGREDQSKRFPFYSKERKKEGYKNTFGFSIDCDFDICDSAQLLKLLEVGIQFKNKQFEEVVELDLRTYFQRYKDLAYDGMKLKCLKKEEDMYTVKVSYKKRFFRKELLMQFIAFNDNPEYKPLETIKWRIYYGSYEEKVAAFKNIKVSDFRIFPVNPKGYDRSSNTRFYIELKSDNAFYKVEAKPKKRKLAYYRYAEYERKYEQRVTTFEDSIQASLRKNKMNDLYCLYNMTRVLSSNINSSCDVIGRPTCFPFSYFGNLYEGKPRHCIRIDECNIKKEGNTWEDCFPDWIRYYNTHMEELQVQLEQIKADPVKIKQCLCPKPRVYDEYDESEPCFKWVPRKIGSSTGTNIVYIGLGIYNFDREITLGEKQYIFDAVYLNEQGDTILKCSMVSRRNGSFRRVCDHKMMTVIPGFNGLLQQTHTERLALLPGKENMLYFSKYNRRYKLYLDLRQVTKYESNVFILKDITDKTQTMDDLREELTKP